MAYNNSKLQEKARYNAIKDYTAANKVIALMAKAEDAKSSIDENDDKNLLKNQKSALTKYTSAYKALIKLTNAQISIVQMGAVSVRFYQGFLLLL